MKFIRYVVCLLMLFASDYVSGKNYTFDLSVLNGENEHIDMELFNQGIQPPGKYYVSIYVNGDFVDRQFIHFFINELSGKTTLRPCLSTEQLTVYGVNIDKYISPSMLDENKCVSIEAIPQAEIDFNFNQQRLSIVVPPQALLPKVYGIAPEQLWDDGVPAFIMNYKVNTQRTVYKKNNNILSHHYAQIQPGINIGPWRLRSSISWQKEQGWQRSYLYAERGLNALKSRLSLGDITSSGFIFDGIPLVGVKVFSDESMLPLEQWSYSPVVRGSARTQARVEIKQNGYVIANEIVPSGPFELTNIPSSGGRGTLDVTIYENDGTQQHFVVPYDSPVGAVREGYLSYSLSGGRYHASNKSVEAPPFGALEIKYGLPLDLTLYTGLQYASDYHSWTVGVAAMLGGWGALSTDMTHSRSKKLALPREAGSKWRLNYSKSFDLGVSLNMAHELVGQTFRSPSETLDTYCVGDSECFSSSPGNFKKKSNVNIAGALGRWGYLTVMGTHQKYWNTQSALSYGITYGQTLWGNISLNVGITKNKQKENKTENLINLWLSMPLHWRGQGNMTYASYQVMNSNQHGDTHEFGMYGDLFDQKFRWDLRERYTGKKDASHQSSTVNLSYRDTYGEIQGYYGFGDEFRQMGVAINGQSLVTQYGFTLGQNSSDTLALVRTPNVSGVSVGYFNGVKTDFKGDAIVGGLRAYQKNNIDINPSTLPKNAFVQQTSVSVIPTKGAVVPAVLDTHVGEQVLLTVMRENNKLIPFGAIAKVEGDSLNTGIFDDNGTVYLAGVSNKNRIKIRWGKNKGQSCDIEISLPKNKNSMGIYKLNAQCPRI